ncbi:MAG: response regulator, partial [Anaerolineales bacterium]|nr:response regulator [Anaerolineales bacterium]
MGDNSPTLHVLLIEDNPGDAFLVREMLDVSVSDNASMAKLVHVYTLAEALAMLHTRPIPPLDIILLDLSLPDAQGVEGIQLLAQEGGQVPVVVLTGNDDGGLAFQALEAGAQDYLHKDDISPASLHRSLRYAHERHRHALEVLAAQRKQQALQVQIEGERLIRRLVTDVQHEFRTPLAIIQSSALVLARATPDEVNRERVYARIEKAIKRLVQILDYMSKIAEITAVVDVTKATASLDKAINEVRHRQGAAGERLQCEMHGHFDVLIDYEN